MSELRKTSEPMAEGPAEAPPVYLDARRELAARYLFGAGLEIGPLHQPLVMPPGVTVSYVDRLQVADLRREYPELADWNLTEADVLDDRTGLTGFHRCQPLSRALRKSHRHHREPPRTSTTGRGSLSSRRTNGPPPPPHVEVAAPVVAPTAVPIVIKLKQKARSVLRRIRGISRG